MQTLGPYEILGELGRGGMGVVYRGRHAALGHDVAVKVIAGEYLAHGNALRRFEREARAAAKLAGTPGIAGVHDVGRAPDGQYWMAMEFVPGGSLAGRLDEPLTPQQTAELGETLARALAVAHRHGILHRDIKPANVLMREDGSPCLTDFGLAKQTAAGPAVTQLTKSMEVLGTPAYMPPEQARGLSLDARADVYALGATLYECLAGAPAFQGDTVLAVLAAVLRTAPAPLRQLAPGVPADLDTIIRCAMAKEPGDRYATAEALAEDLARFRSGRPIQGSVRRAVPWTAIGVAAATIAAAGLLGAGAWLANRPATDDAVAVVSRAASAEERALQIAQAFRALAHTPPGELEAAVAQLEQRSPSLGIGLAWLGLARYRAGEEREGLAGLTAAVERDPEDPLARVLLAMAYSHSYAQEAAEVIVGDRARWVENSAESVFAETPAMRNAREVIAATLRDVQGMPLWPHVPDGQPFLEFATATEELGRGAVASAERRLADLADHPQLGGQSTFLRGILHHTAGQWTAAARAFAETGDAVRLSAQLASRAWLGEAGALTARREPARPALDEARRWAELAVRQEPDRARTSYIVAMVLHLTQELGGTGRADRAALLAAAVDAAERAAGLAQGEEIAECCRLLGAVHFATGNFAFADASATAQTHLEAAERALTRVLATDRSQGADWATRGEIREQRSKLMERTADPVPALEAAAADYRRAAELDPSNWQALVRLGGMWSNAAYVRVENRAPVGNLLDRALAGFEAAREAGATGAHFHLGRAFARHLRVQNTPMARPTLAQEIELAIADYEAATQSAPFTGDRWALGKMSEACMTRGILATQSNEDARPWFTRAIASMTVQLEPQPDDHELRRMRGRVWVMLAITRGQAGGDVMEAARAAIADLEAVRTAGHETHDSAEFLGRAYVFSGDLDRGIVCYERAITLAPNRPDLRSALEDIRRLKGR